MAADETAVRQRIIKHMNEEHRDSIQRYVEYYARAWRLFSSSAVLKDIQLDRIVITAGWTDHAVLLDPPMASFRDTRERVIKMDSIAVAGLGRSPITIKEYGRPKGFHAVTFAACLGTVLLFASKSNLEPGSYLYLFMPGFASFCAKIRGLMLIVVFIHVSEAAYMTRLMEQHSVPLFSRLWFTWVTSCLIEGVGAFQRLQSIVREKEIERQKQKH